MKEHDLLNFMDIFKPGGTLSSSTLNYDKKRGLDIKRHSQKITIYANPKKISKVEKLIHDYRNIIDIIIEEDTQLNNTVKIRINNEKTLIERQIP